MRAGGGSGAGEPTGVGASSSAAALLCCSIAATMLCSALHWCQQLAAQAKAEHTSLPHVLSDQYCVLVYQQQHTFIYTMQYARIYLYSHIRIDTDIDEE